jgi:hypothetical protein
MDAYLAAFAIAGGLRFVTLDGDFKRYEAQGLQLVLLNRWRRCPHPPPAGTKRTPWRAGRV